MACSVFDRVVKVIASVTGITFASPLTADTPLTGSGIALDSVATLEMLVGLEKEFAIEIPAEDLLRSGATRTVGSLVGFVESRLDGAR